MKRNIILVTLFTIFTLSAGSIGFQKFSEHREEQKALAAIELKQEILAEIKQTIDESFKENLNWPKELEIRGSQYEIVYTFNEDLGAYLERLLKRYRSDHAAIVVIENETGNILAAEGYDRSTRKSNQSLPFSSTHPAASLIKVVTTAHLLESSEVDGDTTFKFRGRGTTLYKSQLKPVSNRFSRTQTFKKAFAYSNNVIFGKAAITKGTGEGLFKMAYDFGFNQEIMSDLSLSPSLFHMAQDQYNLAELASGFNRKTMISPVHAAAMVSVVPNNGAMSVPKVVKKIINKTTGEIFWEADDQFRPVISHDSAEQLKEMMESTVLRGTARGVQRRLPRVVKNRIEVGGKTGSITGGMPFGRRDWFISYAMPKDARQGKGISIAVMNVNIKKWYVKSTYLSGEVMSYYFRNIEPLRDDLASAVTVNIHDKVEL